MTILLKGPDKHTLIQLKDAVYDGLRAVKNAIEDKALVPGAGAFEVAVNQVLQEYKNEIKGMARLGVQAFAEAMLIIPKTLGNFYMKLSLIFFQITGQISCNTRQSRFRSFKNDIILNSTFLLQLQTVVWICKPQLLS